MLTKKLKFPNSPLNLCHVRRALPLDSCLSAAAHLKVSKTLFLQNQQNTKDFLYQLFLLLHNRWPALAIPSLQRWIFPQRQRLLQIFTLHAPALRAAPPKSAAFQTHILPPILSRRYVSAAPKLRGHVSSRPLGSVRHGSGQTQE